MNFECRYCLEEDDLENLISPCKCSGTSKYIHSECLNRWKDENIGNDFYNNCIDCKSEYQYDYIKRENLYIPSNNNYKIFYFLLYGFGIVFNSYILNIDGIKYNNVTIYENTINFTLLVIITNISHNIILYFYFLLFKAFQDFYCLLYFDFF